MMDSCHQLPPSSGTVPWVDTPFSPADLKRFRVTPIQGRHPLEVGGTVRSSPQVTRISVIADMSIFGHCPAHDDFYLVVCNHCSQVVKPQAFQKHCGEGRSKVELEGLSRQNTGLGARGQRAGVQDVLGVGMSWWESPEACGGSTLSLEQTAKHLVRLRQELGGLRKLTPSSFYPREEACWNVKSEEGHIHPETESG